MAGLDRTDAGRRTGRQSARVILRYVRERWAPGRAVPWFPAAGARSPGPYQIHIACP